MGTMTAQILLGTSHPYHGGINPVASLFLSENSSSAWILTPTRLYEDEDSSIRRTVWIPSPTQMFDDALLMTALHVMREPGVIALAESFCSAIMDDRVDTNASLTDLQRSQLHALCRTLPSYPKLVVTVFEQHSSVLDQLGALDSYQLVKEVCLCETATH